MLNKITPAHTTTDQFAYKSVNSGAGTPGKNAITRTRQSHATAVRLTSKPKVFPMSKRVGSSGLPNNFRHITQDMHIMYDRVKVPVPSEVTMLNATVLPMFMSDMRAAKVNMTRIAFIGTSKPGLT